MKSNNSESKSLNLFGMNISHTEGLKAIIVDDDSSMVDFLKQLFEELKFIVYTALTGEDAVAIVEEAGDIDIALVDFRLPGIDGLETIKKISEFSPETVTMIMTGLPTLDSSIRAIRLGASDYILKPFNLENVIAALKRAIKERKIRLETKQLRERISTLENNASHHTKININENIESDGNFHSFPRNNHSTDNIR